MYLASAPGLAVSTSDASLVDLQGEVVETRLQRKLDEIADTLADIEERHIGDHDPAPEALLEAICRDNDAPLEFQSLLRRVEARALTWQQIWDTPGSHDGGLRLLGVAVVRQRDAALAQHGPPPSPEELGTTHAPESSAQRSRWGT